jgi:2-succinyl-6-hydroxy-2,4-cyclohexadiene-1-carboxylate synthase
MATDARSDTAMPDLLPFVDAGPSTGDRLVLVHGFTQTGRCWAPFDDLLAARHRLRLVDAPGHGAAGHATAGLAEAAGLVARTGSPGGEPAVYLGYSMGGRIALRLALDHPALVRRLVLIGASPGLADPAERAAREVADDRLADRIETIGVDAFLDEWLAQPLFAGLPADRVHRAERRRNTASGLAASLRALGTGAQEPLWSRLGELTMPVLLLAGEHDVKFVAIARRTASAIGANASVSVVPGAGHTAHLEQPERTAAAVLDWLAAEVTS